MLTNIKQKVFTTIKDITDNQSNLNNFINGFLIPSKDPYEIWFPYSIEVARLLKPGVFLGVKNFSYVNINSDLLEERYSILEVIEVTIVHYKIKELSETTERHLVQEEFENLINEWYRRISEEEKDTLKIIVKARGYDEELVLCTPERALELNNGDEEFFFKKTSISPIAGEKVYILKELPLKKFINGDLPKRHTSFKAGKHKLFNRIDVFLDQEALFNRHFAIFGFTGAGKSNLVSTLIYNSLINPNKIEKNSTNILIFDINNEYFGLLFDVLLNRDGAVVFLDDPGGNLNMFFKGFITKEILDNAAKELVEKTSLPKALKTSEYKEILYNIAKWLLLNGKIKILSRGKMTYEIVQNLTTKFESFSFMGQGAKEKKEALRKIIKIVELYLKNKGFLHLNFTPYMKLEILNVLNFMFNLIESIIKKEGIENKLISKKILNKYGLLKLNTKVAESILPKLQELIVEFNNTSNSILKETDYYNGITLQELILKTNDETSSLFIFMSDSDNNIKEFFYMFADTLYRLRKNGKTFLNPLTVFILEEADLFIPNTPTGTKEEKSIIEKTKFTAAMLARRGRKYNLGLGIVTQRATYLDTGITAQLATYFVSKLPKRVDRERVAEAFGVESSVLNQTLHFIPGEWLILTHVDALYRKATPVPVKFPNANDRLISNLIKEGENIDSFFIEDIIDNKVETFYDKEEKEIFTPLSDDEELIPDFC